MRGSSWFTAPHRRNHPRVGSWLGFVIRLHARAACSQASRAYPAADAYLVSLVRSGCPNRSGLSLVKETLQTQAAQAGEVTVIEAAEVEVRGNVRKYQLVRHRSFQDRQCGWKGLARPCRGARPRRGPLPG
jgi:hypothetical protein